MRFLSKVDELNCVVESSRRFAGAKIFFTLQGKVNMKNNLAKFIREGSTS